MVRNERYDVIGAAVTATSHLSRRLVWPISEWAVIQAGRLVFFGATLAVETLLDGQQGA